MARPLRIELSGGLYHVTARGDRREDIYFGAPDRERWLQLLGHGRTATGRVAQAHYDHAMRNVFTGTRRAVESKFGTATLTRNQAAAAGNVRTPGGLIVDRTTAAQIGDAARAGVGSGAPVLGGVE